MVQRGHWFVIPGWLGVGYALLVANILLVNGLPDAPADASVGKRTLATRLSPGTVAGLYLALLLLAHGWLAAGVWWLIPPVSALWGLVALAPGLAAAGWVFRYAAEPARLRPAIVLTIATALLHGLAVSAGLWAHR
jgi:1,4-dihydroxy-2-naphthoate octaprenyltransferase